MWGSFPNIDLGLSGLFFSLVSLNYRLVSCNLHSILVTEDKMCMSLGMEGTDLMESAPLSCLNILMSQIPRSGSSAFILLNVYLHKDLPV
jgi:hypothetical protein